MTWQYHAMYGKDAKIPKPKDWDPETGELIVKKTTKKKVEE